MELYCVHSVAQLLINIYSKVYRNHEILEKFGDKTKSQSEEVF